MKLGQIVAICLLLAGCETVKQGTRGSSTTYKRVTFYHRFEDRFGARTSIGRRAIEGVTVAAPKNVPFGSKLFIPDLAGKIGTGHFVVQDRGRKVVGDRIDIYIEAATRLQAQRKIKSLMCLQPYLEVEQE
jgi:3D (Asp-Asp-Asp) domain-containing protein